MKNFSWQLTISLVSLFVSLIIIIVGNGNKYCLSFGFILIAVAIAFFVWYAVNKNNKKIKQIKNHMAKDKLNEYDYKREIKVLNKQQRSLIIGAVVFAILLFALAFMNLA